MRNNAAFGDRGFGFGQSGILDLRIGFFEQGGFGF